MGIIYRRRKNPTETLKMTAHTDSDWAGSHLQSDGKSTSGYIFFLADGAISWSSKRQPTVSTSSTEAEYIGQANAVRHTVHLIQLLNQMHLSIPTPITIYGDNQASIASSKNPEFHARTKHIDVIYHYQREKVRDKLVEFIYVPTAEMAADGLTKPLPRVKFERFLELIKMRKLNTMNEGDKAE